MSNEEHATCWSNQSYITFEIQYGILVKKKKILVLAANNLLNLQTSYFFLFTDLIKHLKDFFSTRITILFSEIFFKKKILKP